MPLYARAFVASREIERENTRARLHAFSYNENENGERGGPARLISNDGVAARPINLLLRDPPNENVRIANAKRVIRCIQLDNNISFCNDGPEDELFSSRGCRKILFGAKSRRFQIIALHDIVIIIGRRVK